MQYGRTRHAMIAVPAFLAMLVAGLATPVTAASSRTFVASGGSDANSCSLVSPCRSFSAALAQTAAGGEIVVLDSAGYGPVVIDKAVAITAPAGVYAGITVPAGGTGVLVTAAGTDDVLLQGLTITGQQGGVGVKLTSAGTLVLDHCTIRGFASPGFSTPGPKPPPPIDAALHVEGPGRFLVRDSLFTRNTTALMIGYSAAHHEGSIEHSTFAANLTGIGVADSTDLTVTDSTISGTTTLSGAGLFATAGVAPASRFRFTRTTIQRFAWGIYASSGPVANSVIVVDSDISQNDIGITTNQGGSVSLSGTRVTHNNTAVYAPSYPVRTSGTNFFADNGTDGDALLPPAGVK
jgi:nitrous oxidase accessory protein NosD